MRADLSLSVEFALLDHALMNLFLHQHGVGHTRIAADHLTMQQNHVDHLLKRGKFSTVSDENNYFFYSYRDCLSLAVGMGPMGP